MAYLIRDRFAHQVKLVEHKPLWDDDKQVWINVNGGKTAMISRDNAGMLLKVDPIKSAVAYELKIVLVSAD